jgi:hypothetical protein
MNRKNELYINVGDYYPYLFYVHLNFGNFEKNDLMLYDIISKYKDDPYIVIIDINCNFIGDDVICIDYDFIILYRKYELINPTYNDVEKTIKNILTYCKWNESLMYNIEEKQFYIMEDDEDIRNVVLSLLRSLKNPTNIKINKV